MPQLRTQLQVPLLQVVESRQSDGMDHLPLHDIVTKRPTDERHALQLCGEWSGIAVQQAFDDPASTKASSIAQIVVDDAEDNIGNVLERPGAGRWFWEHGEEEFPRVA